MSERLPLGIDLGETRVRVAAIARQGGVLHLIGIGFADVTNTVEEALVAALRDVDCHGRRAVAMIRTCDARLRHARFPALSRRESRRAAYFEGIASFGAVHEPIAVRSMTLRHASGEDRMLIAATGVGNVRRSGAILRSAGLRAVRVDHEACVLARTGQLPLLDIGLRRSTIVALSGDIPIARTITIGGIDFTSVLADELSTDIETAEIRKRTIGLGGAGSALLHDFCAAVAAELSALRDAEGIAAPQLRVCGNGARLPEIIPALQQHLAMEVSPVILDELLVAGLPTQAAAFTALDGFNAIAVALPSGSSARVVA